MLTSFFGKSSPINYLLLGIYLLVILLFQGVNSSIDEWNTGTILLLVSNALTLLFSMLLLDFFIRKNSLTQSNTYGIFCFSTGCLLFPIAMNWEMIWSLIFVLLGLRRLFSLHTEKNNVRKLLDASLWFFIASYFYFWNLIWFIPLYLGLASMKNIRFRFLMIPPLTGLGVFLMITAYYLMIDDSIQWMNQWGDQVSLEFLAYGTLPLTVGITSLLAFFVWSFIFRMGKVSDIPKKFKGNYILVIHVAFAGILAALLSGNKTGSELVIMVPGIALVLTGYLERQKDFWLRELMMWVLLLLPILLLIIE